MQRIARLRKRTLPTSAPVRPAPTPRQPLALAAASARAVGRVKTFFADKGFGFIEVGGGQPDLFFHISQVQGHPIVQVGDHLEYSLGEGTKGPIVVELRVVGQNKPWAGLP